MIQQCKTLSISVAAYNVETTLDRCLESCVDSRILDDLEVIVVVDGATDGTAAIARSYAENYPKTFRVIEKENGGYGSTVNESMRRATGRYFRLLDGDDWLDEEGLFDLVQFCKGSDVSAVYCDKVREYPNESSRDKLPSSVPVQQVITDQTIFGQFETSMWDLTFATSIMREHPFELPHHCLYTDSLFVAYHIPYIESAVYLSKPLYHYSLGQSDQQSTSKESIRKHLGDNYLVWEKMFDFYLSLYGDGLSTPMMLRRLRECYKSAYIRTVKQPCSRENKKRLEGLERDLLDKSRMAYDFMASSGAIRLMRLTRGGAYRLLHWYLNWHS